MPRSQRSTSRYTLLAEVALAALVVLGPLSLGGAARWVLAPLVALSGVAAVLAGVGAKRQGQSVRFPLLAVPLAAGAALCAVQLVPLPAGLLGVLSPEAAALREFALVPLGLEGARPVSLDAPATWRELAKHLAYLLAFLAAVQVCRARDSRKRLLSVVAFTGAGVAVVGLGHALLGVQAFFGLMPWVHARPTLVTFFANPNHLAGFLGLSSTVALGLALHTRPRQRALPYALAALASGLGVVLSLSRGGIAFFVFGQALLALLLVRRRREGQGRAVPVWARSAAVLGLLAVLAVGGYATADGLWAEARSVDSVEEVRHSKVALWPMLAGAARAFPVLGMGRGAFEAAFPRYQTEANPNTLTHPENAVLQVAAEWGVPGLLLLAVAVWGFARLLRRGGLESYELAALSAVAALALHNLFDFSLELPACAVAVLVVLASVARPREGARVEGQPGGLRPTPLLLATGAALAAVGLVALGPGRHHLADAEAELAGLVTSKAPVAEVRARGLALMERHPADYLLYRLVASAHAAAGREEAAVALAFVNRALYLAPVDAASHRVAARALLALGRPAQGFLEYRLAYEAGDGGALYSEALPRARRLEDLTRLTPDVPEVAVRMGDLLAGTPGRQELALAYLAWAREHFEGRPGVAALWTREARVRLGMGEPAAAARAWAEVARLEPDARDTHLLHAQVLRARGEGPEALRLLEQLLSRFPADVELAFTLASWQLDASLTRRAKATLEAVSPFLTNYSQRARLFALEAVCLEREGLYSLAAERLQSAARLAPGPDAWFALARMQEKLRRYDAAARSVHEGLRLLPPEARKDALAWVARLEAAERERVDTRRQELTDDPHAREAEQLLRGGSGKAQDAP